MTKFESAEAILAAVGSRWARANGLTITQERITHFADATDDHQWIHVDPVRARGWGRSARAIAHGYLTLVPDVALSAANHPGARPWKMGVNYGTDKSAVSRRR